MNEIPQSALIELALDLTQSLTAQDRFNRLLSHVRNTIPCDAVVLLANKDQRLIPLALQGLNNDVLGRRFNINEHPRFVEICNSTIPVRFPSESSLPDPYDGMLLTREGSLPVHACMGLPLHSNGKLIGVLTLDSMTPNVFDSIPQKTLDLISAMSAAALNTAMLLEQLENHSKHNQQLVTELTNEAREKDGRELIGNSPVMQTLNKEINMVSVSGFTVLIEGETGVGKDIVARKLHQFSNRKNGPLVYVNCAALSENLIESELFGHVKGAFTGAEKDRTGKFSLANGGTIFLDEIGELPLAAQSKLLRAIQNQEIQPVGQDNIENIDVRVLAATNRQLQHEVEEGRFRADLYHRLSVYPINVPPLRAREGDITLLAGYFAEQLRRKLGFQQLTIEPGVLSLLNRYSWPGNVRELEHVISRAALHAKNDSRSAIIVIKLKHIEHLNLTLSNSLSTETKQLLPQKNNDIQATQLSLQQQTQDFQRNVIAQALRQEEGNWAATARYLQTDRANLIRLGKRLGIKIKKDIKVNNEV